MNENFYPLNGDDDVLLFDSHTFTLAKLKDLITEECSSRFLNWDGRAPSGYRIKYDLSRLSFPSFPFFSLNHDIQLKSVRECKLLKVGGSQGWEEGKISILTHICSGETVRDAIQVNLEFCPDKLDESLPILDELDKIRESEEYKRLSNQEVKEDN
jgi:hypothetical protein